jgi:hypothetical protein
MCSLKDDCDDLHYIIHVCGLVLPEDGWKQIEELQKRLLAVVNEIKGQPNAVRMIAVFLALMAGREAFLAYPGVIDALELMRSEVANDTIH